MKKFVLLFACAIAMLTPFSAKANWMGMIQELYDAYSDVNYSNASGQVLSEVPNVYRIDVAFADPANNILSDWHIDNEKRVAFINQSTEEVFYPESYAPAGMCIKMIFNPVLVKPGKYSIRFDAGVANPQGFPDNLNKEYTIKNAFTIAGLVGVDETVAETETVAPVYDLMGRTVLENATMDDINNLPAGMYIFNGKKYVVK